MFFFSNVAKLLACEQAIIYVLQDKLFSLCRKIWEELEKVCPDHLKVSNFPPDKETIVLKF